MGKCVLNSILSFCCCSIILISYSLSPPLILSIINGVSFIISITLSFAVEKKPDCDKKKLLFGMKFVFEIQLIINFPAITEIHK